MSKPAARLTDLHVCPLSDGPKPHVGGPISAPGAPTVLIGGLPAARVTDMCVCVGPPDAIAMGSPTVLIGGLMAARMGDPTVHGGSITMGMPTVLIGESGSGGGGGSAPTGIAAAFAAAAEAVAAFVSFVTESVAALFSPSRLDAIVEGVNTIDSGRNCGNIVDAVIARLRGTDPTATAPDARDGSFEAIEARHGTTLQWGSSFDEAFDAVRDGGDGTTAIVGIRYSGDTASHVVVMTNDDGRVGVLEAQDWGEGNRREVIESPGRANERYNSDGGSNVGWGLVP